MRKNHNRAPFLSLHSRIHTKLNLTSIFLQSFRVFRRDKLTSGSLFLYAERSKRGKKADSPKISIQNTGLSIQNTFFMDLGLHMALWSCWRKYVMMSKLKRCAYSLKKLSIFKSMPRFSSQRLQPLTAHLSGCLSFILSSPSILSHSVGSPHTMNVWVAFEVGFAGCVRCEWLGYTHMCVHHVFAHAHTVLWWLFSKGFVGQTLRGNHWKPTALNRDLCRVHVYWCKYTQKKTQELQSRSKSARTHVSHLKVENEM